VRPTGGQPPASSRPRQGLAPRAPARDRPPRHSTPGPGADDYPLPTEAQWEWAARAGTTTSRYFGDTDKGQADYCWFNVTYTTNPKSEGDGRGRQPVARLKPNAWGLYDVLGNVWEWCEDRRGDEATGEARDPVMRGGSWRSGASHCTASACDPGDPNLKADNIGFRVACRVIAKGH
jgi:formylglycine-generating enzyme required for sulfatase activity